MEIVPYEIPRGSMHDIRVLEGLNDSRCHILCVSDRTLYLLHNYAALDSTFRRRYYVSKTDSGYVIVDEANPDDYALYESVVNQYQLEVLDMTCDIQTGLEAIAAALEKLDININCGGGGGGSGSSVVVNCIQNLPNEDMLPPPDQTHGIPGIDDPPEGFSTWEEYFTYKCKAAYFIWDLERKHMVALRTFDLVTLTSAIVAPVIAGLAGILPAAMTPAGFVVFVASVLAIGITAGASWWYMDEMIEWWDDEKDEIICSLYQSGTSVQAVSALSNALEDAIQAIVSWGILEPVADKIAELLSTAFGQLAGNGIVEPLFKAVAAVVAYDYDCESCENGECARTRTFDSDLEDLYKVSGAGSLVHNVVTYRSAPGSARASGTGTPNEYVVCALTDCFGMEVTPTTTANAWCRGDAGVLEGAGPGVWLRITFMEGGYVDGTVFNYDYGGWITCGNGDLTAHYGDHIAQIQVHFYTGSSGTSNGVYWDDIIITA